MTNESTNTLWFDEVPLKTNYPRLEKDITVDVAIVGGGIAGITTAYLLAKEGKKVAVLEKAQIGSGMTGCTTAFLTANVDLDLEELVKNFGEEKASMVWSSSQEAIETIAKIISTEKIDCEFSRVAAIEYTKFKEDVEFLNNESRLAAQFGFEAEFIQDNQIGFDSLGYLKLENQAKFHPLKYLQALAAKAVANGALIFEETEVTEINGKNLIQVKTKDHLIQADYVAILTHIPFNNPLDIQVKLIPYNTYIIEGTIDTDHLKEGIYWDTDEPYNYFRIDKKDSKMRFILGGCDHKTGQSPEKEGSQYEKLETYFRKLLPKTKFKVERRWSGQVIETIDGLPYIGELLINNHQIIGTGFSGNGMTYGTIAAMLTRDIVLKKENPWLEVYSPQRISSLKEFTAGQADYVKHMARDYILEKKPTGLASIEKDSGKVVEINGRKVAVYKDKDGNLTKLSAVCQHLGCIVDFNNAEKTWDCPCHGSRYYKDGSLMNGPSQKPLPPAEGN